jgi:sec-independent protein translocase protein TatA
MISTPGPLELLLILGLALLVLGPNRLPDAARSAGKAVRDFREALSGEHDHEDEFASGDEDDAIEAGPAAEAEYRERKSGSGTEAGDPAPPPIS